MNSDPFLNLRLSYEIEHDPKTHRRFIIWCARFHPTIEKLLLLNENNRKQILVVAFYIFPRESTESRCLKFAQQHS